MIYFSCGPLALLNRIVHQMLDIELFCNSDEEMGDLLEEILPTYLFREQYLNCKNRLVELREWTGDSFLHSMSALHELILYNFITRMQDIRTDLGKDLFEDIYFDKQCEMLIQQQAQIDHQEELNACKMEDGHDISSVEEIADEYRNPFVFIDFMFGDLDFMLIPELQKTRALGSVFREKHLGINMDFYFELLPIDIQKQYKKEHITMTGEVHTLLQFIHKQVEHGTLNKLFWHNNSPINETNVQIILENLMAAYFDGKGIDVTREALLGNGKVDFKLYKNENDKILIEVKRANSSYLKRGYERQLLDYVHSSGCQNAFYLIVCFTDQEFERAERFIRENVYTEHIQLYINISILDVRIRQPASRR